MQINQLDKEKLKKLALGASGILLCYWVTSVVHQSLLKSAYLNPITGSHDINPYPTIVIVFPTLTTWILALIQNKISIQSQNRVDIPNKNAFKCAACVFVSTMTFNEAIIYTSYPIIAAFKSCNVLSVLLVAILCTRVRNKELNLGKNKIIVGAFVSIGIMIFTIFDPERTQRSNQTQFIGILLLVISLVSDGFLPDWQAEIKSEYSPKPRQILQIINKWAFLISIAWLVIIDQKIWQSLQFINNHPQFRNDLIKNALISYGGQNFVYWMVVEFKQHIVPFIISCRKILTVFISILWYKHEFSFIQISGIIIVLITISFQFYSTLKAKPKAPQNQQMDKLKEKTSQFQDINDRNTEMGINVQNILK